MDSMDSQPMHIQRPNYAYNAFAQQEDLIVADKDIPDDPSLVGTRRTRAGFENLVERMLYATKAAYRYVTPIELIILPSRFSQAGNLPIDITAGSPYLPNPHIPRIMPTHPDQGMFERLRTEARRVPEGLIEDFYEPTCPLRPRVSETDESFNVGLEYWRYDDQTPLKAELFAAYQQTLAPIQAGPNPITNVLINLMDMLNHMNGGIADLPARVCPYCFENGRSNDIAYLLLPCKHPSCTDCWEVRVDTVCTSKELECKTCGTPVTGYMDIFLPNPLDEMD